MQAVDTCLARVGWSKVDWQSPELILPQGMQIDLGGDLRAHGPRLSVQVWQVGIESISKFHGDQAISNKTTQTAA